MQETESRRAYTCCSVCGSNTIGTCNCQLEYIYFHIYNHGSDDFCSGDMEKLIVCLQSPYILVHVYMQENEVHCRRSTSTCKKWNFIFTLVKLELVIIKRVLQLNVVVPVGSQSVVAIKFLKFSSFYIFRVNTWTWKNVHWAENLDKFIIFFLKCINLCYVYRFWHILIFKAAKFCKCVIIHLRNRFMTTKLVLHARDKLSLIKH